MIIARNEEEIDRILDYFIAGGFESRARQFKPDINEWRDWIKEEYFRKSECGVLIFEPHWNYDLQENRIVKTLSWHAPDTLEQYINYGNEDGENRTDT